MVLYMFFCHFNSQTKNNLPVIEISIRVRILNKNNKTCINEIHVMLLVKTCFVEHETLIQASFVFFIFFQSRLPNNLFVTLKKQNHEFTNLKCCKIFLNPLIK